MNKDPFREETLDIRGILIKYLRYWYWFVISVIIALTIAYFINKFSENVYQANATILIRDDRKGGFQPGRVMGELDMFYQRNNVVNEMALLRSYSMVDSALQYMNVGVTYYNIGRLVGEIRMSELYNNSPFVVEWDRNSTPPYNTPVHIKIISEDTYEMEINPKSNFAIFAGKNKVREMRFGEVYRGGNFNLRIKKSNIFTPESHVDREYIFIINNMSSLPGKYISSLNVSPLNEDVSIIRLSFQATHPERATDFLNNLSEVYVRQNLLEKNNTAENTIRFIDQQIGVISDSLNMAQTTLEEFRQTNQMMDVGMVTNRIFSELNQLDSEKSMENIKRSYYTYMLEYIEEGKDFSTVFSPSVLGINEGMLTDMIAELITLHTEKGRLQKISTERSPSIQRINREIDQVNELLKDKLVSLLDASDMLLRELDERIVKIEERFNELPGTDRQFLNIQRRVSLSDDTYNYLMQKRAEAGIAMASNEPDHKIVDRARNAGVVAPNTRRNYTFAFVLGMGIPLGFIVLRNFLDNRIYDKKDVIDAVDFPILGIIPHNKAASENKSLNLLAFNENKSAITEAFRSLRSNLQYFSTDKTNKIISICSTRSQEGKTFTAVNLASVIALSGKKIVLIGADMRKPKLFDEFNILKSPGLSNYLIAENTLDEIIQSVPQSKNMHVISSGPIPPNPSELIESERMDHLISELKGIYDYIIIDTPPIGIVPDATSVIKKSDLCIYIVRQRFTDKASLDFLNEFAEKINVKNICIEINDMKSDGNSYGYGYGGFGYGYYDDEVGENRISKWYHTLRSKI